MRTNASFDLVFFSIIKLYFC